MIDLARAYRRRGGTPHLGRAQSDAGCVDGGARQRQVRGERRQWEARREGLREWARGGRRWAASLAAGRRSLDRQQAAGRSGKVSPQRQTRGSRLVPSSAASEAASRAMV